jgi:hypothetical protein
MHHVSKVLGWREDVKGEHLGPWNRSGGSLIASEELGVHVQQEEVRGEF